MARSRNSARCTAPASASRVSRRTGEIGIRLALGAEPGGVLRHVVGQGMRPVLAGLLVGLAATFWSSRLMSSLLFSIQPYDLPTYLVVGSTLMFTAVASCYLPARQVLRVDPAVALRTE